MFNNSLGLVCIVMMVGLKFHTDVLHSTFCGPGFELKQATTKSKTWIVLLLKFQTRSNSSSMLCIYEKLKLDKTWNTRNIGAKTQQTCI